MGDFLEVVKLVGGFTYLLVGGDLLVRGALGLARRTNLSPMIVGLTVVAIGTSAPELMVSVYAALTGFPGVAIGNVVGSNIANILLVIGLPALIHPMVINDAGMGRQALAMLGVSILLVILCFKGSLGLLDGLLLLGILVAGGVLTFYRRGKLPADDLTDAEAQYQRVLGLPNALPFIGLFIVAGGGALALGADLTVGASVELARQFGVPDEVIGSTVIAFGTSLPELSTTIIAAFHRSSDIALGNVLGSNMLNILAVMGATAAVAEVPVPATFLAFDLWVLLGAAAYLAVHVVRRRTVGRWSAALLTGAYVSYVMMVL
jgi:cation:H+ antiporter